MGMGSEPCGLFTYREKDRSSDPYPEGFPPDWSMATVVPWEIFTLHTKGDGSLSLKGYCAHNYDRAPSRTGIRVCLRVCEWAITLIRNYSMQEWQYPIRARVGSTNTIAQLTFFGYQRNSDGHGFSLCSQEAHVRHNSVSFRRSDLKLHQPKNTIVSFYRTSLWWWI